MGGLIPIIPGGGIIPIPGIPGIIPDFRIISKFLICHERKKQV